MSNERLIATANQFKRLLLDNKLLVVAVVCTTAYLGMHGSEPNTGSCLKSSNEGNRSTPSTRGLSSC